MARKQAPPPQGAPDWVLTYGDMMSLLLCFFIMLAAMANFEKPSEQLQGALESIREAFGGTGMEGNLPDDAIDFRVLVKQIEQIIKTVKDQQRGRHAERGVEGDDFKVRRIREGLELRLGGPVGFERFKDALSADMDVVLRELARQMIGHRNKLEVRGHATVEPLPPGSPFRDQLDLSYARARRVRDRLVELGVNPQALRVTAAGANEPILTRAYTEERLSVNRRVEVVVTQALIDDFAGHDGEQGQLPEQLPWRSVLGDSPATAPGGTDGRDRPSGAPDSAAAPAPAAQTPPRR